MGAKSLQELFVEELRDMYDGEKRLTRALPKLAKAATSTALQTAFRDHARETEGQVTRLERVFRAIGETPRGKKCDGIIGIVEESNTAIEELEGAVLDAALIAGAQKAEHYEIASYGTLAYYAELLGHDQAHDLLGQTLDQEKAADEKLNTIAKSKVNRQALRSGDFASARGEARGFLAAGIRRRASALGMAQDRGPSSSRTSSRSSRSTSRSSSVRSSMTRRRAGTKKR